VIDKLGREAEAFIEPESNEPGKWFAVIAGTSVGVFQYWLVIHIATSGLLFTLLRSTVGPMVQGV
jgi:hypothetical protein